MLYLESFGNPRRFARMAPEVARRKPIIAVKSGRSAAGSRAAASHSAALATSDTAVEALFEQAGVIRANTLQELFDVAVLLSTQPMPRGPRVGVVTNAGGPGILLADMGETHGLVLPELTPETQAALRTVLPPQAGVANPVDMIAAATPAQYARTIELVGADATIDALVVIYIPPLVTDPAEIASAIAHGVGTVPAHKPVLTVFMTSQGIPAALNMGPRGTLPTYIFPENAALALSAAVRYGRWRTRPLGTPLSLSPFAHSAVRAVIDRVLAQASGPSELLSSLAGKATFTVRNQIRNTDFQVRVATEDGTQPTPPHLRLASQGRVHGEPFYLEGRVGAWGSGQQPSPVQVQLRLGETRARIDGTLTQGPQRPGLAAQVAIQGPDPARLSSLLPISIPSLPAYRLEGRLLRNGSTWTLKELQGTIGDSDLAGELSLDTSGKRLVLHGELHSQIFVVDELTGYAPEKKPGRVEPEKVQVPAQVQEQVQERPQAIEVTLRFRSNKVIVAKVPLEQFSTDLQWHNDRLALTPTFHLAGGTVQAQVQVETQTNPLQSTVHITMHQLNLQQFLAWLELRSEDAAKLKTVDKPQAAAKPEATAKPETTGKPAMARQAEAADKLGTAGKLDGQIALQGAGQSLADFLASANGNVLLSMREGQLGRVLIELVGLDVAETIQKALAREKTYQLRCLVADFAVHNGRMETQMLLVDTTDTKVIGGGFIDLRAKMLGLKLEPKAKDFSLFSAQAPLYITGPLAKLSAGPKLGELLLSLSMPVKLGTPENADCQAVLEASQRRYQNSKP